MTLSTTASRVSYAGAGLTGPYSIPFRILSSADVRVILVDADDIETVLALTTDYTIAGVGNATSTLTLVTALAVGETLVIRRAPSMVQPTSIQNEGAYFAKTHEDEFDRLVMQMQSIKDRSDGSFGILESLDPSLHLVRVRPETGKVLAWQSPTQLGNSALDSSAIALPGNGRTVATVSAYLANNKVANVYDFGAIGDGVADDTAAFALMLASGEKHFYVPAGRFLITNTLTPPDDGLLELHPNATLVLSLGVGKRLLYQTAKADITTKLLASGYTANSRQVVLDASANVTSLAVEQVVNFTSTQTGGVTPNWTRIQAIDAGTKTITLYEPLGATYTGVVTMHVKDLRGDFRIVGGIIETSATIGTQSPGIIYLEGYRVAIARGILFRNPAGANSTINTYSHVRFDSCLFAACCDSIIDNTTTFVSGFLILASKHALFSNLQIDGDLFGVYSGGNDFVVITSISCSGRNVAFRNNPTQTSVRAVKTEGDRHCVISQVIARDFETVIEWIDSGHGSISNIIGLNLGWRTAAVNTTAINIASSTGNGNLSHIGLSNIYFENLGGIGIQIEGDGAGRHTLNGLRIKNCRSYGIIADCLYFTASDIVIEEWNTSATAHVPAIYSNVVSTAAAHTYSNVVLLNSNVALYCFNMQAGPQFRFKNIVAATANPLFDTTGGGGADVMRPAWVPTDGSAAALALASAAGYSIREDREIIAYFSVTYPVTADATAAKLAGLPENASSDLAANGAFSGAVGYTDSGLTLTMHVERGTKKIAFYKTDGTQPTNANLSGKTIRGLVRYLV